MGEKAIVVAVIGLIVLFVFSIVWLIRRSFVQHDPERAAASVTVAADAAFELQLPGTPGELYFRFHINGDTDAAYDLLVSGNITEERGGTRSFAVKTSQQSRIKGVGSARYASTTYAVSTSKGSIPLATVRSGDRAVRGVVAEHPRGLLRQGWIYVPRVAGF